MKKYSKILLIIISLLIFNQKVLATTIKETLTKDDNYDTIEPNSTIIGITKFTPNEVITAIKATKAGADDATLYMKRNNTTEGYSAPTIYVYYGTAGGWYSLDENNKPHYIDNKELIDELSNLEIYYVNNKEKIITIDYPNDDINTTKLPKGVSYSDNKLQINSTLSYFEIHTKNNDIISYTFNDSSNNFEVDNTSCYTVKDGYITDYDSKCPKDVIIPNEIKNEKIIGIGWRAFSNKGITSVTIPETIIHIEGNAFIDNNLNKVVIKEKYRLEQSSHCSNCFRTLGENIFGDFTDITFDNYLTRALELIPNEIEINVSKNINCISNNEYEKDCGHIINEYAVLKIEELLKNNGYNVYGENQIEGIIDVEVYKTENQPEALIALETAIGACYNGADKKIKINQTNFETTKEEEQEVNNILKEIEETNDPYFKGYLNEYLFNQIQEKYDYVLKRYSAKGIGYGCGEDVFSEIDSSIQTSTACSEKIIITKNDKVYGTFYSKPTISYYYIDNNYHIGSYLNEKEYVDKYLLREITEKYKITNYEVKIENTLYEEEYNETENMKDYYLHILDKDTNNKWIIAFYKYSDKLASKEVPIKLIPKGELSNGKAINSITSNVTKVTLYGTEEELNKIDYLPVEIEINNEDLTIWKLISKPETIEKISIDHIKVNIILGEKTTKEIKDIRIETFNLDSKYKAAALDANSIKTNVILEGTQEVLDTIDETKIKAIVDLSGYTEGDYEVILKVSGDDLRVKYTATTEKIKIRISEK